MPKDLVVLAADKNIDYGVQGLLSRPAALGIRPVQFDSFVHPRRDPGCVHEAHDFLRSLLGEYQHALVMFDRLGSGREDLAGHELSDEVEARVTAHGWGQRAAVIVLDPEIEVWVFANSPHVERCLGWTGRRPALRRWLETQGLWHPGQVKPFNPKEALVKALQKSKKPRSSAIYRCLGQRVSLRDCSDAAFLRFRQTLTRWFPAQNASGPEGM